jgi:hypothetical protein
LSRKQKKGSPYVLLKQLRELLHERYRAFPAHGIYAITELQIDHYPLTPLKAHKQLLVYKFDQKGVELFPFFTHLAGARQVSDYLFFHICKNKLFVFMCELKSRRPKTGKTQVEASHLLAQYFIEMALRLSKEPLPQIEYRALILSTDPIYTRSASNPRTDRYITLGSGLRYQVVKAGQPLELASYCY